MPTTMSSQTHHGRPPDGAAGDGLCVDVGEGELLGEGDAVTVGVGVGVGVGVETSEVVTLEEVN